MKYNVEFEKLSDGERFIETRETDYPDDFLSEMHEVAINRDLKIISIEKTDNVKRIMSVEDIKLSMSNSPDFMIKCLMTIYDNQTADEKASEDTKHNNNIGFTGADGHILTSFAKQIKRWQDSPEKQKMFKHPLSYTQYQIVKQKMTKYAKQLQRYLKKEEQH